MKDIIFRLPVAAALTLAAVALSPSAHGQQAGKDATPTNLSPQKRAQQSLPPSETQTPDSRTPSSPSDQTQDELAFRGRIEQERGSLLTDPVTKLSYKLDDQSESQNFHRQAGKSQG
jgi:hypothetical protein